MDLMNCKDFTSMGVATRSHITVRFTSVMVIGIELEISRVRAGDFSGKVGTVK